MTAETERREIRETFEDETLLALKMEEGAMNPGKQAASHSLERQRYELSVESRKNRVILNLDLCH